MTLQPTFRRLACIVGRFGADRGGSVAIIFALSSIALIGMVGAAVDYARLNNKRTEMQSACDAAVLAAMRQMQVDGPPAAPSSGAGSSGSTAGATLGGSTSQPYQDLAGKVFKGNLRPNASLLTPSFDLTLTQYGNLIIGLGHFSADVPLSFGALFGKTTSTVESYCETRISGAPGADFHFLVDTSMSMGLAATAADRAKMMAGTAADPRISDSDKGWNVYHSGKPAGCAFACHASRPNFDSVKFPNPPNQITNLQWARENDITLRIDVEREGIESFVDTAEKNKGKAQYQYALNTFSSQYRNVKQLTDAAGIKGAAQNLALGYPMTSTDPDVPTWPDGGGSFDAFANDIKTYKNSPAARGRLQVIVLVTDGVRSQPGVDFASGLLHEFEPGYCDTLKKSGALVGVLYTKYLDDSGNPFFDSDVKPFYGKIEPALQACASSSTLYARGDSPKEIKDGFSALFKALDNALALTH